LQNVDMVLSLGPFHASSQTIGGSGITVSGSTGLSYMWGFGYQVTRTSAASLWIDLPFLFTISGHGSAVISGSYSPFLSPYTPGLRFMVPVHPRISIYGIAGGGFGFFRYPTISLGSSPSLTERSTTHGVLEIGGGVDVRLSQHISIRGEARDYVTGAGLSGSSGRHHIVPLFGLALHN